MNSYLPGPLLTGRPVVADDEFAGRYRVERELGRGATSIVWLAHDRDFSRMVALKVLRDEIATELSAERFLREVRLTAQLHHPNVVPVLNSGEYDGRLFCVLPYMDGGTLRARLERDKQLPIADVIEIGRSIANALASAHERNVLHRDVKPENILFTGGQACLADFGIARAIIQPTGDSTTSTGLVRGTPAYMSPEQAGGDRDYDGRSDLYSLACVLYEALAGVPTFVGATAQQIVAQRLMHAPRPVRVYRPTVSPELEALLDKALATTPADRFQTARAFAEALASVPSEAISTGLRVDRSHRFRNVGIGMVAIAAIATTATVVTRLVSPLTDIVVDTTKIALLPLEGNDSVQQMAYEALYQGLSRWRGVSAADRFLTRETIQRMGGTSSEEGARRVAKALGAGRLVRGHITRDGAAWRAYGALYDTKTGTRLSEASVPFDPGKSADRSRLLDLSDSLVLQGIDPSMARSRNLPAVQEYSRAMRLVTDEWNLRLADSLLRKAIERDPEFAQASLWLAEVRAADQKPSSAWRAAAERAHGQSVLSPRESKLADALVAIAHGNYSDACAHFEAMLRTNESDFIALFGLGQCRVSDSIVVRNPASPSGWSFRSNRYQAAEWFARAFKAAPSLHRGASAGGYRRLQELLLALDRQAIGGLAIATDTIRFLARPEWHGDSITVVPYLRDVVAAGVSRPDPAARAEATRHQRAVFVDIARSWSSALPSSSGVKEALAIALGMSGDATSVDTLRAARRLAADEISRTRLASEEVFLRLEFARIPDSTDITAVRSLADSLLRSQEHPSAEIAGRLSLVAALLGRCSEAGHFAAMAGNGKHPNAAIDSIAVLLAAGCPARIPDDLVAEGFAIRTQASGKPGAQGSQARFEYTLVGRALSLAFPNDPDRLRRLADSSGDYVLRAEQAATDRDSSTVVAILLRQQKRRDGTAKGVSPDARLVEAKIWLAIGDSAHAIAWLDPVLTRPGWVLSVPDEPVSVASMMNSLLLRLQLASRHADDKILKTWSPVFRVLWATADPALRIQVRELRPGL